MTYSIDKVTRVEIIDQEGRSYVNWDENNKVELSFQDDGRTLKVFISNREEKMTKFYDRPMNFFEKLHSGWWWIGQIFEEWCYTMRSEDGEFFNYLQSDYVRYEQDMYYD